MVYCCSLHRHTDRDRHTYTECTAACYTDRQTAKDRKTGRQTQSALLLATQTDRYTDTDRQTYTEGTADYW